jgi:hypothetical protein
MTQRNLLVVKHNNNDNKQRSRQDLQKVLIFFVVFASLSPQGFPGKGGGSQWIA